MTRAREFVRALTAPGRTSPPFVTQLLIAAAVLCPVLVIAQAPEPIRGVAGLALVGFLPGFAIARALGIWDPLQSGIAAIASSLALASLFSTSLLYAHLWSWQACAVALGAVTVAASVVDWRRDGAS